jgi:class 3 adenylate cyclase
MPIDEFSFQRSRGVVWVCDLASSSKLLNSDTSAPILEDFLPRFHWISKATVEAAGGQFIKWTGDGFLAWFETPLHRNLPSQARAVLEAIWHLSLTVNITQLGTTENPMFFIRHGVTYEHDALVTKIQQPNGLEQLDIMGRAVVLAFRLSSIKGRFPSLVADGTVAKSAKEAGYHHIQFKKWAPRGDELLKYFKGERFGTSNLVISTEQKHKPVSIKTFIKKSHHLVSSIQEYQSNGIDPDSFAYRFTTLLSNGPQWAKDVNTEEAKFLFNNLLCTLKDVIEGIDPKPNASKALSRIKA